MTITARVKTRAKKEYVREVCEDAFEIAVSEPPEKGKANKAVIRALAKHFNIPQIDIEIIGGRTSSQKRIQITRR